MWLWSHYITVMSGQPLYVVLSIETFFRLMIKNIDLFDSTSSWQTLREFTVYARYRGPVPGVTERLQRTHPTTFTPPVWREGAGGEFSAGHLILLSLYSLACTDEFRHDGQSIQWSSYYNELFPSSVLTYCILSHCDESYNGVSL